MAAEKTIDRDIDSRRRWQRLALPVRALLAATLLVALLIVTLSNLTHRPLRNGIAPHAVAMTGRDVHPLASRPVASFEGAH
ncbi:MAG: hypothetical protein AB7U62_17940 [Pseudolabrys sp.]